MVETLEEARQQLIDSGLTTGSVGFFLEVEGNQTIARPFGVNVVGGFDAIGYRAMDIATGEVRNFLYLGGAAAVGGPGLDVARGIYSSTVGINDFTGLGLGGSLDFVGQTSGISFFPDGNYTVFTGLTGKDFSVRFSVGYTFEASQINIRDISFDSRPNLDDIGESLLTSAVLDGDPNRVVGGVFDGVKLSWREDYSDGSYTVYEAVASPSSYLEGVDSWNGGRISFHGYKETTFTGKIIVGPDGAIPEVVEETFASFVLDDGSGQEQLIHPGRSFWVDDSTGQVVVECFLAGTPISLWSNADATKPIEKIAPGDLVTSYDDVGNLVPGTVTRVFRNEVRYVLDVFGLRVTPGHVTLSGDGRFDGQHVPMIDILRSDGALVREDGKKIRACTNEPLGSAKDNFIRAIAGQKQPDGSVKVGQTGKIRLGTRYITDDGYDVCVADLIAAAGAQVSADGLVVQRPGAEGVPFFWPFSPGLPRPEDYVLQRSALTLSAIYDAGEWEQIPPLMPRPRMAHTADPDLQLN